MAAAAAASAVTSAFPVRRPAGQRYPRTISRRMTTPASILCSSDGGDRIFWQRSTPGHGFRSCGSVSGLTPETRHHLLAEMLGQRDEVISWPTQKVVNIAKESDEQVQRDIGATIQAEQAILLKSVQDFESRGLITPEEAKTVLPKLSVTIRYDGSLNRPE